MPTHRRSADALIAAAAAAALLGGPRQAAADQSLHALTTLTTGFTDNVQLVPENPTDPDNTPRVTKDAFANIAPGIVFAHEAPRIAQVLRYTINVRLYAEASSANSYSNALQYQAMIPLSPLSELGIDAAASHGRLNAFDTGPADTSIATRARGDVSYARAGGGLSYGRTLSRSWRITESLGSSVFQPTDDTTQVRTRLTIDEALGVTKTFMRDAVSLTGRATYSFLDRGQDILGNDLEDERTLLAGPELRWVHDINQALSTDAMVGATFTVNADTFERGLLLPVGAAYVRFTQDRYGASLGYRHVVATNILVAETEATNVVEARGTVAVPGRDDVVVAGTMGWASGRSLDLAGEQLIGRTTQWIADLSFLWEATDEVNVAFRYQLVRQNREQPLEAIMDERTRRNQVMVVLEGRYPSRQAVELRRRNEGRADGGQEEVDAERETGQVQ
ncbi:MAG TPA: hypothetical protein VKZ63_01460 [Kofleriaceae bacterium]|nr:hypothetical protein [Kofleriaceae bacterium]